MEQVFKNSSWIWINNDNNPDEYAEFTFDFESFSCEEWFKINISCDGNYNLYLNDELISFGQYPDYPDYKVYDTVKLEKVNVGKNTVKIVVWYYGVDTSTYKFDNAGVIFELIKNGKVVENSSKDTLSRLDTTYQNHRELFITTQLGYGFKKLGNVKNDLPYKKSFITEKSKNFSPRPIAKLVLGEKKPNKVTRLADSYVIDLGEETVGFLHLDIIAKEGANLKIYYGEWLNEQGEINKFFGDGGNFYAEYVAKDGKNVYTNYFRRIAGRYLQVYADSDITLNYVGIIPTDYPLQKVPFKLKSDVRNKIYDVAVKTLVCCMHEHYEDCPWREQAMYNMDSRNEMLFTYRAFNDFSFARACLVLMSKGLRDDGLFDICFPGGTNLTIPSFSLIYPVQVYEYIENSKDTSILSEVFPAVKTIIDTFIENIDPVTGLINQFPYPHWNFYEWSFGSSNGEQISRKANDEYQKKCDLILNCEFLYVLSYYKKLCALSNQSFDFDEAKMRNSIVDTFYDKQKGLFKAVDVGEPFYTVLGNSFAILAGLAGQELAEKLVDKSNYQNHTLSTFTKDDLSKNIGASLVPVTLSMSIYLYEALLKTDKKYKDFVLTDMEEKFVKMLDAGATTFWETELGYKDFNMRGSLCHAWSALPILYYHLLNGKDYFDGQL